MAQEYTVSKAFQSTDQNTKEIQIVPTKGGDMHKFMVQVEDQPVAGWIGILKKPGNTVEVGSTIYGDIVENQYGKPQYNSAQKPFDANEPHNTTAPAKQSPASGTDLAGRLEYAISLLENMSSPSKSEDSTSDVAIDLTDLGY